MEYISNTLGNLIEQTAFMNLTVGNLIMIAVACVFLYLAIRHGFEPLLLVPIAFGMLLVNIYPDIMLHAEDSANGTGGLLYYFYVLDEWSILPSLIFLGVGAMTDFGPLIANPKSFLLGAAAQFGIFAAYLGAMAMGFSDKAAAAISIIGGADGPTSIYLAGKLGQAGLPDPRRESRVAQLFAGLGLEALECSVTADLAGRLTASVTICRTHFTREEVAGLTEDLFY